MIVKGFIRSEEEETMSLAEYLVLALSWAKETYETDLPENVPAWDQLSDDDKMEILAHEISCTDGDVEFIPEVPVECSAGGPSQEPKRTIGVIRHIDDLGRIVIPKDFRSRFGVKELDPFEVFAREDGSYLIVPYKD